MASHDDRHRDLELATREDLPWAPAHQTALATDHIPSRASKPATKFLIFYKEQRATWQTELSCSLLVREDGIATALPC